MKRKFSLPCFYLLIVFETRSHVICGGLKLTTLVGGASTLLILESAESMSGSLGFLKPTFENARTIIRISFHAIDNPELHQALSPEL